MRLPLAMLTVAALCCGCATHYDPPEGKSPDVVREFNAPFDAVWTACVEKFATDKAGITTIEKASGIIAAARPVAVPADWQGYVDLGRIDGKPMGESSHVRYASARVTYNVFIRTVAPTKQLVRINAGWTGLAQIRNEWNGYWEPLTGMAAVSSGRFENEFLDDMAHRISPR